MFRSLNAEYASSIIVLTFAIHPPSSVCVSRQFASLTSSDYFVSPAAKTDSSAASCVIWSSVSRLLDPLCRRFPRFAHGRIRHFLPRFPFGQSLSIRGACSGQNRVAQSESQRWIVRVHKLQYGLCSRLRVASFKSG